MINQGQKLLIAWHVHLLRYFKNVKIRKFETEIWLPFPPDYLFQFFGDAGNLDLLTPSWLHFKIITPMPIAMQVGTLIDYRLRIHGWPVFWRTRISKWNPPHYFVDEQLRGPYRLWVHEHHFIPEMGGTRVRDSVQYSVPFDLIIHPLLVRPDLERIFAYRSAVLLERFKSSTEKTS